MIQHTSPNEESTIADKLGTAFSRRTLLRTIGGASAAAIAVAAIGSQATFAAAAQYKTTARVNFRSGAGTSFRVIAVIPTGTIVAHTGQVSNNFFEVGYGGTYGWVHRDYLAPLGSGSDPVIVGSAKATVNLNLRSGPSATNQVLRVVPAGTWLKASNTYRNGYRYVIHNGLAGWVADHLLYWSQNGEPTGEFFTTTARLNLRSEPNTGSTVKLVIPSGATVKALAGTAPGFREIFYNGVGGWASTNYLN